MRGNNSKRRLGGAEQLIENNFNSICVVFTVEQTLRWQYFELLHLHVITNESVDGPCDGAMHSIENREIAL